MKKTISLLALVLPALIAGAQQYTTQTPASTSKQQSNTPLTTNSPVSVTQIKRMFDSPISLQFLAGSQGLGADVRYGLSSNISARFGFGIVPVNADRGFRFSSFAVNGELAARFANLHLMADYAPFNIRFLRLVGGAAYLLRGNANVLISPTDGYKMGGRTITADQLGVINAGVSWRGVAPYAGLSLFRPFPVQKFNINLDLGTYYLSRPGTTFMGTNMLADNEAGAQQFNENMKGYRWMPVVQLNFNVKIK